MNGKYSPLESHLRDSGRPRVTLTFRDIEHIIGAPLPPAAFRHRALWSNNASNWVGTKAWLAAGYATANVDMENGKLVFRKTEAAAPLPAAKSGLPAEERSGSFSLIFGGLKDTVTIAPGTELTDPVDAEWSAGR